MNYLSVENIRKAYGEKVLFSDLTFGLDKGQRMGLLARNGSGKTSLFKCLALQDEPDTGRVVFRQDIEPGLLGQDINYQADDTVWSYALTTGGKAAELLRAYEIDPTADHDWQAFEDYHVWTFEAGAKTIIDQLGLPDPQQLVDTLSGGQKRRLELARLLIEDKDVLLLDEPTNHLDIPMIQWLQKYLEDKQATMLLVTHDRAFLRAICTDILEIDQGEVFRTRGGYEQYLEDKTIREESNQANRDKARQRFKKELEWMRRQPKARTTKSKARINAVSVWKERAAGKKEQGNWEAEINPPRLGSKILEIHHLGIERGGKTLLQDWDFKFAPGVKIGLVGKNGAGKTSFLEVAMGNIPPAKGKVVWGETIQVGYFKQEDGQLKQEMTLLDSIKEKAEVIPLKGGRSLTASQLLDRFAFARNMHMQRVETLSGGEQKRLQLLKVLMDNPNFLILDEPTNDLDIYAIQALEDHLSEFPGCLLTISHDRHFLEKMCDFIFELADGEMKEITGRIDDHVVASAKATKSKPVEKVEREKTTVIFGFNEKRELGLLEVEMPKLEKKKAKLEEELEAAMSDHEALQRLTAEIGEVIAEIERSEDRWLELEALKEEAGK